MAIANQRQTHVSWNEDEEQLVLTRAIELLRADTRMGLTPACNQAMAEVLPPDRHRAELKSIGKCRWAIFPPDVLSNRTGAAKAGTELFLRHQPKRLAELKESLKALGPETAKSGKIDVAPQHKQIQHAPKADIPPGGILITYEELEAALPALPEVVIPKSRPGAQFRWTHAEQAIVLRYGALAFHFNKAKGNTQAAAIAQRKLSEDRRYPEHDSKGQPGIHISPWFRIGLKKESQLIKRTEMRLVNKHIAELQAKAELEAREAGLNPPLAERKPLPPSAFTHMPPPPTTASAPATAAAQPLPDVGQAHTASPVMAALGGVWAALREVMVREVASILTDAAARAGLATILARPNDWQQRGHRPAEPEEPPPVNGTNGQKHEPFIRAETVAPRRPTVLIVGLRNGQNEVIKAEFGHIFDLRFHTNDESKVHLRSVAEQADITIGATDHLPHALEDIIRSRSPHYVRCGGGMMAVKDKLRALQHIVPNPATSTGAAAVAH